MADIGNLKVQITAATSDATTSIDKLIKKLGDLNKALSSANVSKDFVSNLRNLSSALSGLTSATSNMDAANVDAFAKAIGKLATNSSKLSKLDFNMLGTGLRNITSVHIGAEKFAGLKTLSDSLGKITGEKAAKAKAVLPSLAQSLSSLSKINIPNYGDKIINLAASLSKLGGTKVLAAKDLPQVAEGLALFEGVEEKIPNVDKIVSLSTALSKFGNANMTKAISQMPSLATNFRSLMETLSTAPKVSSETIRLAEAMAEMAKASKSASGAMQKTANGTNSFKSSLLSTIPAMNKVRKHTFSLAAMFGKLYASYFLVIRAFRGLGKAIEVSSSLTEVENVVAATFGNMTDKLDEFADTSMYKFGLAELAAKQYASRFQAMGQAMGITSKQVASTTEFLTNKLEGQKRDIEGIEDSYADLGSSMSDMSINLTKLVSDYASFFNMDYGDVAKDFESIFTGQTRPMRQYGIDLTVATLKEWALKNGLDANIKSMTSAEKAMLRYQYVMAQSGKVMNDYQITMNNWANVVRTIGQQFTKLGSIIGQGLINTFKPALIAFRNFMNTIIKLSEKTLNAIGKLMGWQVEIEEVGVSMDDSMEDYADSLDDAAGSAKKLNTQLRGIDELNNLTTSKGSGSDTGLISGLANGGNVTGGAMRFENYESDIDSWFELGKRIADNIRKALDGIKWNKIFSKARRFGSNFADYLNGVINPETFYSVGRTIANAINTGIEAAYSFGSRFDFENLGLSIANAINGFFENFNFKKLAKSISKFVEGLKKTIVTAIKNIKWNKILSGAFDFASNLNFDIYALLGLASITKIPVAIKAIKKLFSLFSKSKLKILNAFQIAQVQYNLAMKEGANNAEAFAGILQRSTSSLSTAAKGFIGLGSAVAEFGLIESGVKGLITDTDKLGENIAKIIGGGSVGLIGLISTMGLAAGGATAFVTAFFGAVTGITVAIDELNQKSINDIFKGSFSEGVDLQEYIAALTDKISGMGDGFELISEKSSSLETAKKNVSDVVFEISRIKTEMDASVTSVEDASEKLSGLFGELEEAVSVKLQNAAAVIYATFGENSVVGSLYGYTEENLKAIRENTALSVSETERQVANLVEKLNNTEPNSELWLDYYSQLLQIIEGTTELDEATNILNEDISKGLDLSSYYDEEGKLQIGLLLEDFHGIIQASSDVVDATDKVIEKNKEAAKEAGNLKLYDSLNAGQEDALDKLTTDNAAMIKTVTDQIQYDLIDEITAQIDGAKKKWDEMNWFEQLIYGFDEDEYIREQVNSYKRNYIDPLSKDIEESFSALGIDGAGWSSDAAEEIIHGLFITDPETPTQLNSNYQEIVDEAMNKIEGESAKNAGEKLVVDLLDGTKQVTYSDYLPYTNSLADNFQRALNESFSGIKTPSIELNGRIDIQNGKIPSLNVVPYATGGLPQTGSLFYAGEAGAELLGTMNGKTTVASNGEITGISDTIRQTSSEEIQLLRQQNQLLQGILQKEFGISKNDLFRSVRSSASEYHKMTGNPAFA